ncbi:hypothetical protein Mapa_009357 [Marchantia paleacea]|nr:hypothetical protein Mapa_009357 [Marchantia paleacea]
MKVIKNNDAAKKMAQRPNRGSKAESRSQAENLILSGWQGSDEDEDVNIDSSDDEKAFSVPRRKLRARPSSRPGENWHHQSGDIVTERNRPVSSPHFERSGPGPGPGGVSVMKVKSLDARRFRKELTAKKSGAKMAVIPQFSFNESPMRGSLGNEKRDRRKEAAVEDLDDGEALPAKAPDTGNKRRVVKQSPAKYGGTIDKLDKEQRDYPKETRKKKGRDSKETTEYDDEESRKRRYRELEQAQRALDRKLTLRERPESRSRDDGLMREIIIQGNVGRRLRTASRILPQETDSIGRLLVEKEVVTAALGIEETPNPDKVLHFKKKAKRSDHRVPVSIETDGISSTHLDKHASKKSDMSSTPRKGKDTAKKLDKSTIPVKDTEKKDVDLETAEKSFERRSTRSAEKLRDISPSKPAPGVPAEVICFSKAGSKNPGMDKGKDCTREETSVLVPLLQSDELSISTTKSRGSSIDRRVEKSLTSTKKAYKDTIAKEQATVNEDESRRSVHTQAHLAGESHQAGNKASAFEKCRVDEQAGAGTQVIDDNSSDGGLDGESTRPSRKETGIFGSEAVDHLNEMALVDGRNLSEETQQTLEENNNSAEEKRGLGLTEDDSNQQIVVSEEAKVAVNIDVGPNEEKEDRDNSKRMTRNSIERTERSVPELYQSDKIKDRAVFQVSEDSVEDRESRFLRPPNEGGSDPSTEGLAKLTGLGGASSLDIIRDTRSQSQQSLSGTGKGPEAEVAVDKSNDQLDARREGSAATSVEEGGDMNLSNVLNERCCDASGCKVTYHLECADPNMKEVPEGKWYCPTCTQKRLSFGVNASLKAVESIWEVRDCICHSCNGSPGVILDQKRHVSGEPSGMIHGAEDVSYLTMKDQDKGPGMVEDSPSSSTSIPQRLTRRKQSELEFRRQLEKRKADMVASTEVTSAVMSQSAEGLCRGCDKQYFVKYKNLSHIHNAWVCESELKKAAPKMLETFKKRLESDNPNQGRIKWQSTWQVPQRFLLRRLNAPPRRPGGGRGRGFLGMDAGLEWFVKWQDLGYEHCTWEQVQSGLLDVGISKRLESSYDRWCEGARRRSHPTRIEEVMRLREADFKPLSKQPDWFQGCKLSAHQLEELNGLRERWYHHHNTLMVDESDQERTRTAVSFLLSLIEEYGSSRPILVIVPLNGCQMWESELLRSAEHVYTVVYTGSTSGRSVIQRHELNPSEKPIKFQIVLTTFEVANSDHDHLIKFEWEAVVLDEGHRSRVTKSYRHMQFVAPHRLILLNDFSKCSVWELQQFVVYLEPENHALESELQKQLGEWDEETQLTFLKGKLAEKMVGESRSDETTRLEFKEHWAAGQMTPTQVHLYCTELTKHYSLLYFGRMRSDQTSSSLHGLIATLRNVCNHPFLVDPTLQEDLLLNLKPKQSLVDAGIQLCGKFETLQRMVSHLHAKGRRVLLLCQTDVLCCYFDDYMRQLFGADSYECVFKGSESNKNQAIQRFNAEDSTRFVFILKKNTTGVSFQLRETDDVIVYDSDWNPANDLQYLEKVIYKVKGQLSVYRLYTPLSVEEAAIVYSRQRRLELQSGLRIMTARYCQQIVKWKVKELLSLDDFYKRRRRGSEKIHMAEISEDIVRAREENAKVVKKILDGVGEAEALSLNEEMPEEDGETVKKFWSSMLKDRYTGLQDDELTNGGKGLRSRKRVHYGEDALALASYAAGNEEEVRKKRRKSQGSELVQRGSPRATILHSSLKSSPVPVVESCADETLPAGCITKEVNDLDAVPREHVEAATVIAEKATTVNVEVARQAEEETSASQTPMTQREESVSSLLPGKASTKSAVGVNATASEEGRKTRSEQQQIMLGLWRPDVTKICKTLDFSEKIATYADQLLVYCMKSYRMPKEPKDLVLQVQIALCVVAAERFHQELDHLTTLSRVEEAMDVKLKTESWTDNYQKFVSCCKEYPLPLTPSADTEQHIQAQTADIVPDASSPSKSTENEPSVPLPISEGPDSSLPVQDVDKPPVLQTPDCCDTAIIVDEPDSPDQRNPSPNSVASSGHADQSQPTEKDEELQARGLPEVPSTVPAQTADALASSLREVQAVGETSVTQESLQSSVSQMNKEQIHEKLNTERHEIHSVVVYQQTQELNEFNRSRTFAKEGMLKRHQERVAELMKTVVDSVQRTNALRAETETHAEDLRKLDSAYEEQHEMLVKRQRKIRDEVHSVYSDLLQQLGTGTSRSLYLEAQSILAKVGVNSVAAAQSVLRAVSEEAKRKKASVDATEDPVVQVRSQTGLTVAQSPTPIIRESPNLIQAIQNLSPLQSDADAGGHPQPLHGTQPSQLQHSQPLLSSEPQLSQLLQPHPPSQPFMAQIQQSAALASHMSHARNPPQTLQPSLSSVQANEVHQSLPPRPTIPPRQQYLPVQENLQSPHQQLSALQVPVANSVPSQFTHHAGRTHTVQPSPPSQQQWTAQAWQASAEQQRIIQARQVQTPTIQRQQALWHASSSGQGLPAYTRQQPQSQQSSNQGHVLPSTVVSCSATQGSHNGHVIMSKYTQAMFLPAIPASMLGPDPILQEESRLKKEKEKIRAVHEQKAAELKLQYAREIEDAQRKYEALMAEMKKKFDGLLEENFRTYNQQNLAIHQTHVKVHRSRLLAEALRTRGMFDVAYQHRNTAQQGDESAAGSGQMRSIQNGTAGPSSRGQVQPAPTSALPIRHVAAVSSEGITNTGNGQFVSAASPASRAFLQSFHQNNAVPSRTLSASQGELSPGSIQGFSSSLVATHPTPSTYQSSLFPSKDVEGQRTESALGNVQPNNNLSTGPRLPVPPTAGRMLVTSHQSNLSAGSPYTGSSNVAVNVPSRGTPGAMPVQSSGRVNGLGGSPGIGLWQSCSPNSITRPVNWQNGVSLMTSPTPMPSPMAPQPCTTETLPGRISGEPPWNHPSTGSVTSNPPSSGLIQPCFENSHTTQISTSQNTGNVNAQRRSWSMDGTGNHPTTIRMVSQPSLVVPDGPSENLVPVTTTIAATERLPVVTEAVLESVNLPGSTVPMPESCALGDWSSLALPPPISHPDLSTMAPREPDLGGVATVDALNGGLVDRSNVPPNTNRPDVIYLSDDD